MAIKYACFLAVLLLFSLSAEVVSGKRQCHVDTIICEVFDEDGQCVTYSSTTICEGQSFVQPASQEDSNLV